MFELSDQFKDESLKKALALNREVDALCAPDEPLPPKKHRGKQNNIDELPAKTPTSVAWPAPKCCPRCGSETQTVQEVALTIKKALAAAISNLDSIGQQTNTYRLAF